MMTAKIKGHWPITTTNFADPLGVSPQRVRKVCRDERIGACPSPALRLLTAADFQELSKFIGDKK